jgi:hypothetical protein
LKKITGISVRKMFLLLTASSLLCSLAIIPLAQATLPPINRVPWLTNDFVNPVEPKIAEFKAKGLTEAQITEELGKLGMGWNPDSGATALLDTPSPDELKGLPSTKPQPGSSGSRTTTQKNVVFATPTLDYTGIGNYMYPGSMPLDADETHTHYITTHLGRPAPYYKWTEVGVAHWGSNQYVYYFTYDDDEQISGSNWAFHGIKSNLDVSDAYTIVLNGTSDGSGYWYNIYINWNWKRNGHLPYSGNEANVANEIFSDTGVFTEDSGCKFHDNYLSNYYYSWVNWNQYISYDVYDSPGYMDWDAWLSDGRYDFESWTL